MIFNPVRCADAAINGIDNQLTAANKTGSANSLTYDGAGRLSQTTLAGVVTNLSYDGTDLIAEYDNAVSWAIVGWR
ncbi:MAG: hypothetical protein U1E09_16450 [Methylococcales bacterium]|nr:hypothetical protein [Methylococcales bacterium]